MIFNTKDSDDVDFFDGPDLPDEPQEPHRPSPKPENPDYWEDESEWEHLRPVVRRKNKFYIVAALILLAGIIALLIWMFRPYSSQATQYGYVEGIEYRGTIFKTFEGELIPYKEIHDTTRMMKGNFSFSTRDPKLFRTLKRMQMQGRPVRVEYSTYHSAMPWRGESKAIVVSVDSVDPSTILPPR